MKRTYFPFIIVILLGSNTLFSQIEFVEIAKEIGIDELGLNHGVSLVDFDQDGMDDIYIAKKLGPNRLYKNLGENQFKDVARELGLNYKGDSPLAIWGDINNDGLPDLFLSTYDGGDKLFLNQGNHQFSEISTEAGMDSNGKAIAAAYTDINNDGWIDLYCARNYAQNTLYLNLGNNRFKDITDESGAKDSLASMGVLFFDYDNDNDQDLYLVRDALLPNILYQNDGKGHFINVARDAGIGEKGYGMGAAVADINHDGWLDLYITNLYHNAFFLNNGDGTFRDISELTQTRDFGVGWGISFLDADNDGLQDIYLTNTGYYFQSLPSLPNVFYHHQEELIFEDISKNTSLASTNDSYGIACGDLNNDGRTDILVANSAGPNGIEYFQNQTHNDHHWVKFNLHGTHSNRMAIGARIALKSAGFWQTQIVSGGSGWASQNSSTLHFGLKQAEMIDSVLIKWPSGQIDDYTNLEVDKRFEFTEFSGNRSGKMDREALIQVRLQPNPFVEELKVMIQLKETALVKVFLTNLTGKMVKAYPEKIFPAGIQSLVFANENFKPGVYLCHIQTSLGNKVRKLVIAPN